MDDIIVFKDKSNKPTEKDLLETLGSTFDLWKKIVEFVMTKYPLGQEEWNFSGAKRGWSFRIKDEKRAIIYLLPRGKYFIVSFALGQKAVDVVLESDMFSGLKTELEQAKKYAEGSGIQLMVKDGSVLYDIEQLIDIKLNN